MLCVVATNTSHIQLDLSDGSPISSGLSSEVSQTYCFAQRNHVVAASTLAAGHVLINRQDILL